MDQLLELDCALAEIGKSDGAAGSLEPMSKAANFVEIAPFERTSHEDQLLVQATREVGDDRMDFRVV